MEFVARALPSPRTCIRPHHGYSGRDHLARISSRKQGELAAALEYYAEGARLFREQNDLLAYAHAIRHIADIYREEGNPVAARPLYEEALELYRGNLGTKLLDLANTVRPYALLNEDLGDIALAWKFWEEARNLYGSLRIHADVSECETHIARLDA